MIAVVQRVSEAIVLVRTTSAKNEIKRGLVVLVGIAENDTDADAKWLADKILNLRIFPNENGKFDRSVLDIKGECLVVSQFTLLGDCGKGRRPDFTGAAKGEAASSLYGNFVKYMKDSGLKIATGEFAADMLVEIHNDGPVTIILDSRRKPRERER